MTQIADSVKFKESVIYPNVDIQLTKGYGAVARQVIWIHLGLGVGGGKKLFSP